MNKFQTIATACLASVLLASCDMLGFDETSGSLTKEGVYEYFGTAKKVLTNVYSYIPQPGALSNGNSLHDAAMNDAACDDAEFGNIQADVQDVNNGNWSAKNPYDPKWTLYSGIRAANAFIEDIAHADFSRFENDASYKSWMEQLKYWKEEARVLRAYFLFELARRYGDIAMPLTVLTAEEANHITKTPFQAVIRYIVTECDECVRVLPESYVNVPGGEVGRVTKGFAMALKSKALLYAASPLHNGNEDKNRWQEAAKAALDLIESRLYQLDPNGCIHNLTSKENVLMRSNNNSRRFELFNFPLRMTEGARTAAQIDWSNFPTQDLVDAFETENGYPVILTETGWESEDPAFNPDRPYDNRDSRFSRTILADGMEFKGSRIEIFEGGIDDLIVPLGGSPTGYFLRKFIQETTSFTPDKEVSEKHHWVIYRYAETLLTYAESMINAFDDANYTDDTFKYSALWAINQVRANAGMPEIPACPKAEFVRRLRNEWRVEFAFEDHRFWDVRRWKIGSETQTAIHSVRIKKDAEGKRHFYRQVCETRNWKEAMNLFPVPQSEIFKNRNLLPQNTGW